MPQLIDAAWIFTFSPSGTLRPEEALSHGAWRAELLYTWDRGRGRGDSRFEPAERLVNQPWDT